LSAAAGARQRWVDTLLAWYFVSVWGSGYLATKVGLQYAPPFTFLSLRYLFGLACLAPALLLLRPKWPHSPALLGHVIVAGLLMHAVQLGGSHYAQYFGVSAGIVALIFCTQPLLTALIASRWLQEVLVPRQWAGVAIGLGGVALVVWHKIDVHALTLGSLLALAVGVAGITAGTLYQRVFCPRVDLNAAAFVQFAASLVVLAPLAWGVEGAKIVWAWQLFAAIGFLVVFASIFAVNVLHTLMRHGQATKVTSLLYLPPIFAVALEFLMFDVVPSALSAFGIAVTCLGVALVAWQTRRAPAPPAE